MSEILFQYQHVNVTSWAYLSSLLMIALFFKFGRLLSVRNLDLVGLILLAPGLLAVLHGFENPGIPGSPAAKSASSLLHLGYAWLLIVGAIIFLRMVFDSTMVRRPLLEPNMNSSGLTFLGISLFMFLMANVVTGTPGEGALRGARAAEELSRRHQEESAKETFSKYGPGLQSIFLLPHIIGRASTKALIHETNASVSSNGVETDETFSIVFTAKFMAILSQLAIVLGMLAISVWNFDNGKIGTASATLYLLLPYTAAWTGYVSHVLPAALLVWAVASYRRPLVAGILLGLAISVVYYPLYLLPLWISFYWRRGRRRFLIGIAIAVAVVLISLAFRSANVAEFWEQIRAVFGFRLPAFDEKNLGGIWQYWNKIYRIPILALFLCFAFGLAFWPAQKNLGTLISCSAAVMLGTQFWHPTISGLAMAWYLPFVLLTIFRPNLEDRVAETIVYRGKW